MVLSILSNRLFQPVFGVKLENANLGPPTAVMNATRLTVTITPLEFVNSVIRKKSTKTFPDLTLAFDTAKLVLLSF